MFIKKILTTLFLLGLACSTFAQVPQFFNENTSSSSNVYPLSTTTNNKVQWLYQPNSFSTLGGGLGTPAYAGNISKIYFRIGTLANPTSTYNIFISLGQNMGTTAAFPNATYTTGLTLTFADPAYNFVGVTPNQWYGIELQTPFFYDPSLSLIFEMEQTGGTGNYLSQSNLPGNIRRYGLFGSAVANGFGTGLVDFGFDLRQDSLFYCPGAPPLVLATGNPGTITWSVNSGNATLSSTTGSTITAVPTTVSRVIASSSVNNLKDTFILIPVTAIVDAGVTDTLVGCAPITGMLNGSLVNPLPFINYDIAWAPAASIVANANTLTPTVNPSVQTTYVLTATSSQSQGACPFIDSVLIDVDDYTPVASFNYDLHLGCVNDTVIFTNTSTENPKGNPTYNWNFGDANFDNIENPTHIYGAQNTYVVTLTVTDSGCTNAISTSIDITHPLEVDFFITNSGIASDDSICVGSNFIFSPVTTPMAGTANMTFDWDFGNGESRLNAGPLQQTYKYPNAGTFVVRLVVTDTLGCSDTAAYTVFVDILPYIRLAASDTIICAGDMVQFSDSISTNTFSTTYNFDDGIIQSNIHNPAHTYPTPGIYNVNFSGEYLVCPPLDTTISITVNAYPQINLGEDKMLCPGADSAAVINDINNPSQILQWSTGVTASSISVRPEDVGKYWAKTENNGCTTTDSILIERDCYLNIPNTFSPNNDGNNDYFIPRQILSSGVTDFGMTIMNRWGEVVYSTISEQGRGWDGKFGGIDQPVGVYVYSIEAKWRNGYRNIFRGNVTLLR